MAPVITAKNLTKIFDETPAVDTLNLTVDKGEIYGLVGPDGAGKTTTIRMLAAIMLPTKGRATILGHDTYDEPEAIKANIGYMAQRFNLYRDLTVWENLNFFADIFEVKDDVRRTRIERLLHFARLTDFQDRRADHLSGGMQKKLALSCTLIHEPKILFLDEPTTGVDPVSRREFWQILTELHLEGTTIFVSTPYMDEADRCSQVGLLYQGKLVISDTPENIRQTLDGTLLRVQTPHLRRASVLISEMEGVIEVQTYGDLLHVFVDNLSERQKQIARQMKKADLTVIDIQPVRPRMEEAFISLIRAQQEK